MVVDQLHELLNARGIVTELIQVETPQIPSKIYKTSKAFEVSFGKGYSPDLRLQHFEPDVIHVHNLFPNIGTSWLKAWGTKSLMTVHNYRNICANGMLVRRGESCTLCLEYGTANSIKHGCYRNSKLATIPLYLKSKREILEGSTLAKFKSVIFLNEPAREMHRHLLHDKQQTYILPNPINTVFKDSNPSPDGVFYLYAGVIKPEKGIVDLVENWLIHYPKLLICGTGPFENYLRQISGRNVVLLGKQSRDSVFSYIKKAKAVIIPSLCREMLPNTYVESLSLGKPVLVNDKCDVSKLVKIHKTGYIFRDFTEIEKAFTFLDSSEAPTSSHLKSVYSDIYHYEKIVEKQIEIYEETA